MAKHWRTTQGDDTGPSLGQLVWMGIVTGAIICLALGGCSLSYSSSIYEGCYDEVRKERYPC